METHNLQEVFAEARGAEGLGAVSPLKLASYTCVSTSGLALKNKGGFIYFAYEMATGSALKKTMLSENWHAGPHMPMQNDISGCNCLA